MAEKSGVEQSKLLTTVKSTLGDIVLQADTSGRSISSVIGGQLVESLSSGVRFFKSHTGYSQSGAYSKTYAVSTTDNTATVLASISVPSGYAVSVRCHVVGMQDDMTDAACYTAIGCATNNAGTTAMKGTALYQVVESNASCDATITANDTTDAIELKVTGITAENWAWTAQVQYLIVKTSA